MNSTLAPTPIMQSIHALTTATWRLNLKARYLILIGAAALSLNDAVAHDGIAFAKEAATNGVWIDVTQAPYFAKGDGKTDDTAALQRAISDHVQSKQGANRARTLFLPSGVYLVSDTLDWVDSEGLNGAMLFIRGAGRERTVIKLRDGAPAFADPASTKPVIKTRSMHNPAWYNHSPQGRELGEGHLAFYNGIFDLTVDTGDSNPGADGISFHVCNMGGLRGVTVRASESNRGAGLNLTTRNVGPGLLADVKVKGFSVGMRYSGLYIITAENLTFEGQSRAAIENTGGVMALRKLSVLGPNGRVINQSQTGLIHLLDSSFSSQTASPSPLPAVEGAGGFVLARVTAQGFSGVATDSSGNSIGQKVDFWASNVLNAESSAKAAFLEIREAPPNPVLSTENWANVRDHGADPTDSVDDTNAIQAALNSGRPGIIFPNWDGPPSGYIVTRTLAVPSSVQWIKGDFSNIRIPEESFLTATESQPQAVFEIRETSKHPLVVEDLFVRNHGAKATSVQSLLHASPRTLVVRNFRFNTIANGAGAGLLFLENVSGHNPIAGSLQLTHPQQVWARQLNLEDIARPKILAGGGVKLWILGLKTERPATVLKAWGDAHVEIWGALNYQHHPSPSVAYELRDAARLKIGFATCTTGEQSRAAYPVLVDILRADRPRVTILTDESNRRGEDTRAALVTWLESGN